MTSLNTRTGWDTNKQTGSNLTPSGGGSSISGIQEIREVASSQKEGSGFGISNSSVNVTPSTSSSSSSPSSSSSLLTPGESGTGSTIILGYNDTKTLTDNYFLKKYDPMTGVRIASTLGGFFLLVLLTLLYKSKCKGKHSREPSTLSLNQQMAYPIHPGHLILRGRNVQVNGRPDFSGGGGSGCGGSYENYNVGRGGGGDSSPTHPVSLTLLDSTCYGYLNQIHPTNSHQPVYSNYHCDTADVKSPAVLLITAANSESSDEELSVISTADKPRYHHQRNRQCGDDGVCSEVPPYSKGKVRHHHPLGSVQVSSSTSTGDQYFLHPRAKSPPLRIAAGGKGNIDINVILPTPNVSPSGSENFNVNGGQYFGNRTVALFPSVSSGGGGGSNKIHSNGRNMLLHSRSLSSDNENDNSEEVSCDAAGDLSESCEAPMLPFGCANSSLFSLENLKYMDDTSSENIPTRASDADEQDQDTRSIGSDSVFACFEHNFDHIAPTYARRVSSVSCTSSGVLGTSPQPPHRQFANNNINNGIHNTNNTTTGNPLTSSIGTGTDGTMKAAASSGFADGDDTEFRVTLTAHAQVHRDSFCSDLESVNDYMETGARRRSSSTQTTLNDLRQALGYSPTTGWSGGGISPGTASLTSYSVSHEHNANNHPRRLSVPRRRRSLSPNMNPINNAASSQTGSNTCPQTPSPLFSATLHPAASTTNNPPPTLLVTDGGGGGVVGDDESGSGSSGSGGFGGGNGNNKGTDSSLQTPTNPPATLLSLSQASTETGTSFIPPSSRMMRKRSSEAIRKTLSLQCEEKADVASLYVTTSSNETTPTN